MVASRFRRNGCFARCADVGDVHDPLGVGLVGGEVAGQMVAHESRAHIRALVPPAPLLRHARQIGIRHQPGDPVKTGRLAFIAKHFVHARRAHHAIAGRMVLTDLREQPRVVLIAGTG